VDRPVAGTEELDAPRRAQQPEVRTPPMVWIQERIARLQEVLERRTEIGAALA
jgi:hypothetical protein